MGRVGTHTKRPQPRDRLIAAARDLFGRQGYGVSVDAIAEHAAVAKPTVYAHFGSKDALIGAVLQSLDDEWFATLEAEIDLRDGDPQAQLLAPFDLLVKDLPDPLYHGCLFINGAATFLSSTHPAPRALASHDERMLGVFERLAAAAGG